ncbi:MAG: Fic family protein [Methanomassiliicoccales archaeon]
MIERRPRVPFKPDIIVPREFKERIKQIQQHDYELSRFILKAEDLAEIIMDAYASNVHWSTKFEGNPLSQDEVKRITRETMTETSRGEEPNGPTQEVINHLGVMSGSDKYRIPWDENKICSLHKSLLSNTNYSGTIGSYRTGQGVIEDNDGTPVFYATPPEAIIGQMNYLYEWINTYSGAYDPVVSATIMFHELESIHPFSDGNGRTGRTLFHLYLQQNGLANSYLCKVDINVLKDKEAYYQLLAYTDYKKSYTELIDYMSECILESYSEAVEYLRTKDLMSSGLDENKKRLIIKSKAVKGWFKVADAYPWIDGRTQQTTRNHLNELCDEGILEKRGNTKSLEYKFKDPLESYFNKINKTTPA